jgi:type 1 glutamine amidotransferase
VRDAKHPAVKHFGESYCIQQEEIYLMINYTPSKVRELLVLDKHPNHKTKSGSYPIAWCKNYGQGKVFYTSLGHREDVWENKAYQAHVLGAIRWVLGMEPGEATPIAD